MTVTVPTREQIIQDLRIREVTYKVDKLGRRIPKTNIEYGVLRPILEKEKRNGKTKKL